MPTPPDFHILNGDCLDVLRVFDANTFEAVVCDPRYGLRFMGKAWDHGVPGVPFWEAALRVAKPGAHLLAFGGIDIDPESCKIARARIKAACSEYLD